MSTVETNHTPVASSLPSSWNILRLKHLLIETDERVGNASAPQLTLSKHHGVIPKDAGERTTEAPNPLSKIARIGDLVLNKMQAWNGILAISDYEGSVSPDYATFRFIQPVYSKFLEYLFRTDLMSKEFLTRSNGIGTAYLRINIQELLDIKVGLPPKEDLLRIQGHLDRATTRIDALVAKKTRFIELLREKRQALITHAVTKGLDRSASMKDSGVEWLGEVPAHWDVVQSRRLFSERNEKARVDDQQLTASQKYGLLPQAEFMEREGRRIVVVQKGHDILKRTLPGDFVISMRSFQGGLELSEYEGSVSSAYVPITPIKWVVPAYFRWAFKSITYIQALQATSDLVRDGQALRFENFTKVPLPHVPLDEQAAIADFLNRATTRIDTLIAKTERSIELLREHRTALITAAVTGKLDLRPAA